MPAELNQLHGLKLKSHEVRVIININNESASVLKTIYQVYSSPTSFKGYKCKIEVLCNNGKLFLAKANFYYNEFGDMKLFVFLILATTTHSGISHNILMLSW